MGENRQLGLSLIHIFAFVVDKIQRTPQSIGHKKKICSANAKA